MLKQEDLLQEIEHLFFAPNITYQNNFKDEVLTLLFETEPLQGNNSTEKWNDFLEKKSMWEKIHILKQDWMQLFGYQMWNLNISIYECRVPDPIELKQFLIKTYLIDCLSDDEDLEGFGTIINYLNIECFDEIEFHGYSLLSQEDFLKELDNYYNISYSRFKAWKKSYPHLKDMSSRFQEGYKKYQNYLECIKFSDLKYKIIKINKIEEAEFCLYYILGDEKIFFLKFSDFG